MSSRFSQTNVRLTIIHITITIKFRRNENTIVDNNQISESYSEYPSVVSDLNVLSFPHQSLSVLIHVLFDIGSTYQNESTNTDTQNLLDPRTKST